jgi:hypothetical protein
MASHAVQPDPSEARLSAKEGWELILRSFGSGKDLCAEYGGGEAWLRQERESWNPESVGEEQAP